MLHQKDGIKWLQGITRGLLADEAGLGKTKQILDAAIPFLKGRSMLVICPTSVVLNWYEEGRKWKFPENKLFVVGAEFQFLKEINNLKRGKWGVIVVDEAHMFKSVEAQRTQALIKLIKGRDSKMWFMTGTPIIRGAMDLFVILSIIEPGKHGKYREFCDKYCMKKPNRWKPGGFEYYGVKNERILNAVLSKVMLRRYKCDHLEDLPDKTVSRVPIDLQIDLPIFRNDEITRKIIKGVETGGSAVKGDIELSETMQELSIRKVEHVLKFAENLFMHPLVFFAHHRSVLYMIHDALKEKGFKVGVIVGGMDKDAKMKIVNDFQDGKIDHVVVSILAGGVGINLFRSSRCIFAEFPWTWAAMDQAASRLHRYGQKDCVNIYYCFAKNTFEEKQLDAIEDRKIYTEKTVGLK